MEYPKNYLKLTLSPKPEIEVSQWLTQRRVPNESIKKQQLRESILNSNDILLEMIVE
jgi:hypothetical protein